METYPIPIYSTQKLHAMARDRNRASPVKGRQLATHGTVDNVTHLGQFVSK